MAVNPDTFPMPDATAVTAAAPVAPSVAPDVAEPVGIVKAGVTTSEWKLALGFLGQLAAAGTTYAASRAGVAIPPDVLPVLIALEFAGASVVVAYIYSRTQVKAAASAANTSHA